MMVSVIFLTSQLSLRDYSEVYFKSPNNCPEEEILIEK